MELMLLCKYIATVPGRPAENIALMYQELWKNKIKQHKAKQTAWSPKTSFSESKAGKHGTKLHQVKDQRGGPLL